MTIATGVGGCVNPAISSPTATQALSADEIGPGSTIATGPSTTIQLSGVIASCWNPAAATSVTCCTSSSAFSSASTGCAYACHVTI